MFGCRLPERLYFFPFGRLTENFFPYLSVFTYLHGHGPCSMYISCMLNILLHFPTCQVNRLQKFIFFFFINSTASVFSCGDITLGDAGEEIKMVFNFNEMSVMKLCILTALIKPGIDASMAIAESLIHPLGCKSGRAAPAPILLIAQAGVIHLAWPERRYCWFTAPAECRAGTLTPACSSACS